MVGATLTLLIDRVLGNGTRVIKVRDLRSPASRAAPQSGDVLVLYPPEHPALTGSWRVQACSSDGVLTLTQLQPGFALDADELPADAWQRYMLWLVDQPLPCATAAGSRVHYRLLPGRHQMACGLEIADLREAAPDDPRPVCRRCQQSHRSGRLALDREGWASRFSSAVWNPGRRQASARAPEIWPTPAQGARCADGGRVTPPGRLLLGQVLPARWVS